MSPGPRRLDCEVHSRWNDERLATPAGVKSVAPRERMRFCRLTTEHLLRQTKAGEADSCEHGIDAKIPNAAPDEECRRECSFALEKLKEAS